MGWGNECNAAGTGGSLLVSFSYWFKFRPGNISIAQRDRGIRKRKCFSSTVLYRTVRFANTALHKK